MNASTRFLPETTSVEGHGRPVACQPDTRCLCGFVNDVVTSSLSHSLSPPRRIDSPLPPTVIAVLLQLRGIVLGSASQS